MNHVHRPVERLIGVSLAVISAACFGALGILGRYAYQDGMDATTIMFLRFSMAAAFMAFLLAARKEPLPRGGVLLRLIGMGAIGYTFQSLCYLLAVKYASPGLVALLLYLYPVLVAGLSAVLLKEKLDRVKIFALFLALAGTALTVNPQGGQILGIVYAIAAAVIYALYIIVGTQVMSKVSVYQSSTVIFASAAASLGVMTAINGAHMPASPVGWFAIVGIVIVSTIIPVIAFLASLQRKKERLPKGSPERKKAVHALRHAYQRQTNRRNNFCHQESRKLVHNYQWIVFEDLDIRGMQSEGNHLINRGIADVAWGQFVRYTTKKAAEAVRGVVRVDPRNTTQQCSGCSSMVHKDLYVRKHQYPHCGLELGRDQNADLNILARGLASFRLRPLEAAGLFVPAE